MQQNYKAYTAILSVDIAHEGFCIELVEKLPETLTREVYWEFQTWKIGEQQYSMSNNKQYGGYEVTLTEAKNYIYKRNNISF
ncbi:MAG: hypothetical protein PUP92_19615 [Rhizonema sp. PD38]|nr:hypothetical protein [Rhizonema sp. PD38]